MMMMMNEFKCITFIKSNTVIQRSEREMTTAVALKVFGHLSHRLLMDVIALDQGFPDPGTSYVNCAIIKILLNYIFELMFMQVDINAIKGLNYVCFAYLGSLH